MPPTTTRDDIEQGAEVDVTARVEAVRDAEDCRDRVVLLDVARNRFQLTLFEESPEYDLVEGEWYTFRRATGNVYAGQVEILPNFGTMTVEHVPEPPDELLADPIEGSPLAALFGDHAKTRALIALADAAPRGLDAAEIVENGALESRAEWEAVRADLLATGLIARTRTAGGDDTYALREDDPRTARLLELRDRTGAALERNGHFDRA